MAGCAVCSLVIDHAQEHFTFLTSNLHQFTDSTRSIAVRSDLLQLLCSSSASASASSFPSVCISVSLRSIVMRCSFSPLVLSVRCSHHHGRVRQKSLSHFHHCGVFSFLSSSSFFLSHSTGCLAILPVVAVRTAAMPFAPWVQLPPSAPQQPLPLVCHSGNYHPPMQSECRRRTPLPPQYGICWHPFRSSHLISSFSLSHSFMFFVLISVQFFFPSTGALVCLCCVLPLLPSHSPFASLHILICCRCCCFHACFLSKRHFLLSFSRMLSFHVSVSIFSSLRLLVSVRIWLHHSAVAKGTWGTKARLPTWPHWRRAQGRDLAPDRCCMDVRGCGMRCWMCGMLGMCEMGNS